MPSPQIFGKSSTFCSFKRNDLVFTIWQKKKNRLVLNLIICFFFYSPISPFLSLLFSKTRRTTWAPFMYWYIAVPTEAQTVTHSVRYLSINWYAMSRIIKSINPKTLHKVPSYFKKEIDNYLLKLAFDEKDCGFSHVIMEIWKL